MVVARKPKRQGHDDQNQEVGHVRLLGIREIFPSPENDQLYRPIDETDPDFRDLVNSIIRDGVRDPIKITLDKFIVSGHRRFAAAKRAGLNVVPVLVEPIYRENNRDEFVRQLAIHNKQRIKSFDEKLRETVVQVDAADAYKALITQRADESITFLDTLDLGEVKARKKISAAKMPMLQAVVRIVNERRKFWPLTDRQIHYSILNDSPLRHASKPHSTYRNDGNSYGDLCDLLTRARLDGTIPFQAIADETRPVTVYKGWRDPQSFLREEVDGLFKGYYRNLQQSQPNHIEMLVEKNTVAPICKQVAMEYCIPMTSGRGFCSLPPRYDMYQRFKRSGKQKLILLIVADFDPAGENIAQSFPRSMRDDFGVRQIEAVKVALTQGQAEEYELPPSLDIREKDEKYIRKFVEKYGSDAWELEALPPSTLQDLVDEAIRTSLDIDKYNDEVDAEAQDARHLQAARQTAIKSLGSFTQEGAGE